MTFYFPFYFRTYNLGFFLIIIINTKLFYETKFLVPLTKHFLRSSTREFWNECFGIFPVFPRLNDNLVTDTGAQFRVHVFSVTYKSVAASEQTTTFTFVRGRAILTRLKCVYSGESVLWVLLLSLLGPN